jgi:hypothetical protein
MIIAYICIGLSVFWALLNILWFVLLIVKKYTKIKIPKEVIFTIKKTMKLNLYYLIIFGILGFLFL